MTSNIYQQLAVSNCFKFLIGEFGYMPIVRQDGMYLVKRPLLFHIYEHIGELNFDIYNIDDGTWGWDVSSIILENLDPTLIRDYMAKYADAGEVFPFLAPKSEQQLLASLEILKLHFQDLLTGKADKYKKFFQPLSDGKIAELNQIADNM